MKEKEYDEAARIFQKTNVQITTEGRRLLGAALGTATVTEYFVGDRVAALEQELDTLDKVAQTQPQAAHSRRFRLLQNFMKNAKIASRRAVFSLKFHRI